MRALRATRFLAYLTALASIALAATAAPAGAGNDRTNVYTLTNSSSGNAVAIFDRSANGTLTPAGTVPTGGLGTGAGLGSQNALVLSDNGNRLFAVNAGDNTISAFRVNASGLELLGAPVTSGGSSPISLSVHGNILYVLNAGAPANITGFRVEHGGLVPIAGSTRPLSGPSVGPAEVQFSPDGKLLVVTERNTNLIDTYVVGHGLATGPNSQPSAAATPFGFAFDSRGRLVVSDAVGGAPAASGLSSYEVSKAGALSAVTPFLGDTQTAACWVVVTKDGRFAYTTNTGSNSISTYRIDKDGSLSLRNPVGGSTGPTPIDEALSRDGRYLYALTSGAIDAFRVGGEGSLSPIAGAGGLPAGDMGLAAR